MSIEKYQVWVSKTDETQAVLVLRVFDYRVSYQQDGSIKNMGDFEFKDNFKLETKRPEAK